MSEFDDFIEVEHTAYIRCICGNFVAGSGDTVQKAKTSVVANAREDGWVVLKCDGVSQSFCPGCKRRA